MCLGIQAERVKAVSVGLNQTRATILDMSATEPLKAPNQAGAAPALGTSISVHSELRAPHTTQSGCQNQPLTGKLPPHSDPPRAAVSCALLIAALSFCLTGCDILQSAPVARTAAPPPAETKGAQQLAATTKPPEAPAQPAPPAPAQPQSISKPEQPPVTATKGPERLVVTTTRGAERLVAPSAPVAVRAREKTTIPAESSTASAPMVETSGVVTGAEVNALIIKGPPHQARPRRVGMKLLLWFGLGLGVVALGVLARLYIVRHAKPLAIPDDAIEESLPTPGLLFKEPVDLPQEPVTSENS